jgi:DNA mismatch endonuclease (patch repair protein)
LKKYTENQIVVPRFNEANGFYTTKQRSELMAKIKSQNTKPELNLKKALWNLGFRYRKNLKKLPGSPDIVYTKHKLAIFVDGEFWHGYNWAEKKTKIKTNRDFWIPKIERNIQRDIQNNQLLTEAGWHVIRFWEHELKKDFEDCLNRVISYLQDGV